MRIALESGAMEAVVDDADAPVVLGFKWYPLVKKNGRVYARANACKAGGKKATSVFMHRLVAGAGPGVQVDHLNRDGLDNRRVNLRLCGPEGNARNKKKQDGCESRFKGVSRGSRVWRARITVCGRTQHLGVFDTEESAALAYDAAARRFFGEFARLNSQGVA